MIVDGRAIANESVLTRVQDRVSRLTRPPRVLALVANVTPATTSYLKIKEKCARDAGCVLEIQQFPESVSTELLQAAIADATTDAIIVQLPLPPQVDTAAVCDTIPLEKDADVLSSRARERFEHNASDALMPPVVGAISEIINCENVALGERAVVIGSGFLVGAPVAIWLRQQGLKVGVLTRESGNLGERLLTADIIVSGVGSPHLIKPGMIKDGVVLIDAGTSESGGAIVGDADPACADKCSLFTPVPGGVGPLAVACLFENVVTLAERTMNQ